MKSVIFLALYAGSYAHQSEPAEDTKVTPVQKVIQMIKDLKSEAETEAKNEATDYGKFACWCKTTTEAKSTSILKGQDTINTESANIKDDTATKEDKEAEIDERNVKHEELEKKLAETKARLAKETAIYEETDADLTKAISSLEGAIQAMADTGGARFLQTSTKKTIKDTLDLAQVFDLLPAQKRAKIAAFLQSSVDPNDPEYKYHSQGIIDVMVDLKADFVKNKANVDAEWEKTKTNENQLISQTESDIETNQNAIDQLKTDVQNLDVAIAGARSTLVEADDLLKDDQLFLKDMTARCEQRAHAFDQRSSMRGDEITALTQALTILEGKVQGADEAANVRAFLQQHQQVFKSAPSFVQLAAVHAHNTAAISLAGGNKAIATLRSEGARLGSSTLSMLALKLSTSSDPFAKVKELIQKLIERLIHEATSEADKKGFCDLRVSKAEKNRLHRWEDVTRLNSELASLEAKEDQLDYENGELETQIGDLKNAIEEDADNRNTTHHANMQTLADAKAGLEAVTEALLVLKQFYKQAAKASVFVQTHASPLAEEGADANAASGAYQGNQEASQAILGLLEVIKSDFERTIKNTSEDESTDAAAHVKSHRVAFSDQKGKEMKKKLNEEDLSKTANSIASKSDELQKNMNLVDAALKETEKLKPLCIDTGMTYAERVAKREEEIGALKKALCQLDGEKVETEICTDNGGEWEPVSED